MAPVFTMLTRVLTLLVLLVTLNYCGVYCAGRFGEINIDAYREKVRRMFYHAYEGYLNYAYPYDELQPLTCKGHDTWGSYSLTLIDAMDTLAVMGNYSEFRRIAQILIDKGESFFDIDINASVFETNIRIVGGLLSGHLLMKKAGMLLEPAWPCSGPLLRMAENVARKILPAFDTPTGMPYGTVNLRHGVPKGETTVTCTAGVGTFIVEFGTLSRLTGDPVFEKAAIRAIRALWKFRSSLGMLGNHIDVSNGKWTALDSGIGGGIDSYFEYLIKGAIMFNIPELLHMFREYEVPIKKYLKRGDWYMWAQMNKGSITLPLFTSLDGYWPSIQSLVGDLEEAVKTIHNFHQVWRQFGFTPEYYNIPKAEVHQGREGYPLRPEIIESIMYLYRATKDPYLLEVGVDIVETIEHSARTSCGYATVKDVRDHQLEDRMESFFLAETTKYLYLLFDPENFIHNNGSHGEIINTPSGPCVIGAGGYVFNTEAHPIDLAAVHCCSAEKKEEDRILEEFHNNLDILSLLNVLGEDTDDTDWLLQKRKRTKNKKEKLNTGQIFDNQDIVGVGGPGEGVVTKEELVGMTEALTKVESAEQDHLKSHGHSKLEVIDMTIFTEMERNLTHHFMKEQQIKALLKNISTHLADKLKEQYRATSFEHLATDVAGKILKAGSDPTADNSSASSEENRPEGDLSITVKGDEENEKGPNVDTKSVDQASGSQSESIDGKTEEDTKVVDSNTGVLNDKKLTESDVKAAVGTDISFNNGKLTINIGFVSEKEEAAAPSLETKSEGSVSKPAGLSAVLEDTDKNDGNSPDGQSDQLIKMDGASDGIVQNVMQHKISVDGENKIVVVHLQKKEETTTDTGVSQSQEAEKVQEEKTTEDDDNTKPSDPAAERFKSHIQLEIQNQDTQQTQADPMDPTTPLSASPPSETPLVSLENKRNNLLTLTSKILNIFSGSKEDTAKPPVEVEARVPSLAGLYSSLANYTIRYFHNPVILHCPAQSFHQKISVYGEVFPDV